MTCADRARAEIESFVIKKVTLLHERVNDWINILFVFRALLVSIN